MSSASRPNMEPLREPKCICQRKNYIVIIIVGIIAGSLAGNIVRGGGYGLIGDLIVGVIGAFIGDCRLCRNWAPRLRAGIVALVANATLGAIVLLILLRLNQRGRRRGMAWPRFGRRW